MQHDFEMTESGPGQLAKEGLQQFHQGNREQAVALFEAAAEEFAQQGDLVNQGEMYNNIGVIQRLNRNWSQAEESLLKAKALFNEANDEVRLGQALGNLGDLSANQRKYEDAERCYSESSVLLKEAGQRQMQAEVLRALSIMQIRRRKWWTAVDTLNKSLKARPHPSLIQRLLSAFLGLALRLVSSHP